MTLSPLRGSLLCVPLALWLLLPGVSQAAQQPPPESPATAAPLPAAPPDETPTPAAPTPTVSAPERRAVPGTQSDAPRRLVQEGEDPWQPPARAPIPRGLRILAEAGAGLGLAVAFGTGGGLLGLGLCLAGPLATSWWFFGAFLCVYPMYIGLAVGALVGFPLGSWIAGERLDGDGSFLAALGFASLGALVGIPLANVTPFAPFVLLGAGSILGYELFQRLPVPKAINAHVRLQPLVSFSGFSGHAGPVLGMSGRF